MLLRSCVACNSNRNLAFLSVCSFALGSDALDVAIDAKPVDGEVRAVSMHTAVDCWLTASVCCSMAALAIVLC